MSIQHLETLALPAFINAVRNIGTMHASEKLDGANLWMGLDAEGRLFTTREGKRKNAPRFFSEAEYPAFAAYNGFRAAHAALEEKIADIKRVMQPEQMVEMEILYGRQPNAITYGHDDKSYIAFLRGVNGTPNVIADQLSTTLGGTSVEVTVDIIDTTNGEDLEVHPQTIAFQFTGAQRIPAEKLKDVNLSKHIDALEKFLKEPAGIQGSEATNMELLANSLATFSVDIRPEAKEKKTALLAKVMTDFKLPIKKELLDNYVSKIKPALGALDVSADEDVGIEGVVLRDPTTGDMIKLVDTDAFTTINSFNHAIRNQISGVVKTLDSTAPLEARGGILGDMKIKIADLLGNAELARGAAAKKIMASAGGSDPIQTIKNFAGNLEINDFLGMKRKLLALIKQAAIDLQLLLDDFNEHKEDFQLKLKNGKVIGISPEIEKRTLLVFAESRKNVLDLFDKLKLAKSLAQVVAIMYGNAAKAVHETADGPVNEELSIILETKQDTDKVRYAGKDAWTLMNIYFATVLMAAIIYKVNDKKGLRLLRDKTHYKLASWDKDMSPLNFWGYPIWKSSTTTVKKLIGVKAAAQLFKTVRKTAPSQPRYLHMDLSFGNDVPIEWSDHFKTMHLLQQLEGMASERVNHLLVNVFKYEELSLDQRVKTLSKLFYYVQQFIPSSPLFLRLKAIQDDVLLNANGENEQMTQEMKLLAGVNALIEDGAEAVTSQLSTATTANATASTDGVGSVNNSYQIIKRKRNPSVKRNRFVKPSNEPITTGK